MRPTWGLSMTLLNLKDVTVNYGKSEAVKVVSLKIQEGSVVGIIGANGAGKSTILKAISGVTPPTKGEIRFLDKKISGLVTHDIVRLGVIHVPEGRRLFPGHERHGQP